MEPESAALCSLVESELFGRPSALRSIATRVRTGRSRVVSVRTHGRPIATWRSCTPFSELLDESLQHHRYLVEPQSRQYLTHGDLWDHLYLRAGRAEGSVFLPLTLEMGSWLWVKKNPRQLFTRRGIFNPVVEHRRQRVLRRHVGWLDFVRAPSAVTRAV